MEETKLDKLKKMSPLEIRYPSVFDRCKAAVIDSMVIIFFMLLITKIFSEFDHVPDHFRIAGFIFIFFLYEPLFVSLFSGTIGHMLINIKVKRSANTDKNIAFPLAVIRFILKLLLGWLSLLTVGSHEKALALHDMAVGSIVLYGDENKARVTPPVD